jgi:predicted DNA binding CopG/RHH family protein
MKTEECEELVIRLPKSTMKKLRKLEKKGIAVQDYIREAVETMLSIDKENKF